ncbi:MAG TPA: putative porin [Sediminibacterium sp.]
MRLLSGRKIWLGLLLLLLGNSALQAQSRFGQTGNLQTNTAPITYDSQGRPMKKNTGNDSLQRRDRNADSITIFYKYFDSSRLRTIDSSINDFTTRFPLPYYYHTLGNYSTASQSYFFNPILKPGFDAGFHQYDIYSFTVEGTKLYQTTRPYTELSYVLGSKAEQLLSVTHTQNRNSNLNFSVEYRFNNAPGNLKNQNASQNNFRFVTHYQTLNKKYENFLVFISNKSASSENGGLQDVAKLDSLALNDPYELETRLGKAGTAGRNPFNTAVNTGNIYKNTTFLYRHHFDLGSRDSLVTDSVTYQLFYPRFRIEHTFRYTTSNYNFFDKFVDSARYQKYFNYTTRDNQPISFKDAWSDLYNEFSLISFPDKNNLSQFLKAGIALQNLKGTFDDSVETISLYNFSLLGEYRNRTRNQVWDIEATGQLYVNGFHSGDYAAYISMKRMLGKKLGYLNIGFQNVNRAPSFILNPISRFPVANQGAYGKENVIRFFALYENPRNGWKLGGEYFAVNNYMYFDSFFSAKQYATLFNVLHLTAEKKFRLSKYWNWYTEIHLQQTTGQPPVNIPFILTRNRIAFEGNFATNLFLSTGLEVRYTTAYKADDYSPFIGQYFVQNTNTISNRPDITAFMHFRIKSFKGFLRVENLNTLNVKNGFSFNKPNFMTTYNPGTGLWTRFGLWWNFVN